MLRQSTQDELKHEVTIYKTSAALKNNPFRFSIFTENGLVKVPLDVVKHFCLIEFDIVAI